MVNLEALKQEQYKAQETVNGVDMTCRWDEGYNDYVLYFPQITLGEGMPDDQLFRISNNPDTAKKVFEYAKKVTETESDVNKVYLKAKDFAQAEVA